MKKIILVLLAALPVLIVFFTALGAGVIIRELKTHPVESVEFNYEKIAQDGHYMGQQNYLTLNKGESIDLKNYISVFPAKASFSSLIFVSADSDIIDVNDGIITAKKYMRGYTRIPVEIKNNDGLKTFFVLNVGVNSPSEDNIIASIDYIGFYLNVYTQNVIYGQYCTEEDGKLIIDKDIMNDVSANGKFDILEGLKVGPRQALTVVEEALISVEGAFVLQGDALQLNADGFYTVSSVGAVSVTVSFNDISQTLQIVVR